MISIPKGLLVTAVVLALLTLILVVWTVVDLARRPPWQLSTGRKWVMIASLVLGWLLVWPIAAVTALIYLLGLRKRLNAIEPPVGWGTGHPPVVAPPGPPIELPPAAWYPDPAGSSGMRWWDGLGWSDHVRPGGGA